MDYLLHQLLQTSAELYPARVAISDGSRAITYRDLEHRANQLANLLLDVGVARGDRVGLYMDKSIESVLGIYAVLKCGAAYVPFDPQAPVERLGYIARNCGMRLLLTGREKSSAWQSLVNAASGLDTLIVLNATTGGVDKPPGIRVLGTDTEEAYPASPPIVPMIDLDLAYILYTSGSTGDPKGVMLSHLNALTFVNWAVKTFDVQSEDRLSSHAPLHFDLSVFDLFGAAKAGSTVVLVPPKTSVFPIEVGRFIEREQITIWYSVPSVLSMLALRGGLKGGKLPHLRMILFAGEVFPTKYLRGLMEVLPHVAFFNLYGPTETNVCTYYPVPRLPEDQTDPIPIGEAISNVEVFAVTDNRTLAHPGEVGELWVRGSSVMLGYWGDEERTARGLFANPFGGEVDDPVYRTGDLARQDPDGNFRLLGRRDAQIKSRGYRIELGEVEAALYAHPAVVECAAVAIPDELVTNRIKAYVVARDSTTQADLVRFCGERLPAYMIPEFLEFRETLPKTSTGKIDRRRLAGATEEDNGERRGDDRGASADLHRRQVPLGRNAG